MSPSADVHPVRLARLAKRHTNGDSWRLQDLAEEIGKSASMVSSVEHGFIPKPATALKIAGALDTTVEALWPGEFEEVAVS